MRDMELAKRKIHEKRRLLKLYMEEYRKLTSGVPDLIEYSTRDKVHVQAQVVRPLLEFKPQEVGDPLAGQTTEQIEAQIRMHEATERSFDSGICVKVERPDGERPVFENEADRFVFLGVEEKCGRPLSEDEKTFMARFAQNVTGDVSEMYEIQISVRVEANEAGSAPRTRAAG